MAQEINAPLISDIQEEPLPIENHVHRAVHLELATDISADSVLHCIRRFVSRRGRPNKLVSVTEAAFAATWHNEI